MLSRFGRWALGLYMPAIPEDLQITETAVQDDGRTKVISTPPIPPDRRKRLEARQERQHERLNELQVYVAEREIAEAGGEPQA